MLYETDSHGYDDAESEEFLHLATTRNRKRRLNDIDVEDGRSLSTSVTGTPRNSPSTSAYSADVESLGEKKQKSKDFVLAAMPCAVKKNKEDSMVFPDPFPLPTNFRPDVEVCLEKRKITKCTRAAFFTSVSSAMFQYKRFPSRDDYVSVARQIVGKYPFLGSAGFGASYVSH